VERASRNDIRTEAIDCALHRMKFPDTTQEETARHLARHCGGWRDPYRLFMIHQIRMKKT
jgi:hypothetical protein